MESGRWNTRGSREERRLRKPEVLSDSDKALMFSTNLPMFVSSRMKLRNVTDCCTERGIVHVLVQVRVQIQVQHTHKRNPHT